MIGLTYFCSDLTLMIVAKESARLWSTFAAFFWSIQMRLIYYLPAGLETDHKKHKSIWEMKE